MVITFNVSSYGATFGTGLSTGTRTANKTALRDCFAAAEAAAAGGAEVEVVIDSAGTLECYVDPATDAVAMDIGGTRTMIARIAPVGAMTVRGLSTASQIAFFPDGPTFDYTMLYVDEFSAPRNVTFKDLTAVGPATFGVDDPTGDYVRHAVQHQGATTPGSHARSTLTFDNFATSGMFHAAVNSNSGDIDVVAQNGCSIVALFATMSIFNQGNNLKRFHFLDSYSKHTYTATNQGVGLYIHPNISTRIQDSTADSGTRYAVYFNGGPSLPVPEYCEILDVTKTGNGDFIQSNKTTTTVVRGCTSSVGDGHAQCSVLGPVDIGPGLGHLGASFLKNTFTGGEIAAVAGDGFSSLMHVHGNTIIGIAEGIGSSVYGPNMIVEDNEFDLNDAQWAATAGGIPGDGDEVLIQNNTLDGTFKGLLACFDTHGTITVRDNIIAPTGVGRAIYGIGTGTVTPTLDLLLEGNVFPDNAIMLLTFPDGLVRGSDNTVRESFPIDFASDPPSVHAIVNKEGADPTPRASAGSVSLHAGYSAASITGVAAISNLYIANNADQNGAFLGNYALTFVSACSTTSAGNINPTTTAARAPGSTGYFAWNQDTLKWDEYTPSTAPDTTRAILTDTLAISDGASGKPLLIARTVRPNFGVGVAAPVGSLCTCTADGTLWMKTGAAANAWTQMATV